jgi:hypothetical protein
VLRKKLTNDETNDDRLMKMQARYTGSLKAARPPLSTTP